MTKKTILLLGGSGQIGQAFRHTNLPINWEVIAPSRQQCDITNISSLRETVQTIKPVIVINAAAMTAVDACEKEKDLAHTINFDAPAHLAAQCSSVEALLIHLSTDYVFDGKDSQKPYRTEDPMNPVNVYGASKMMGEEAIRHELPWHVIIRISSVFSEFGTNILTKAISSINERDELKIVDDQIACPTYAPVVVAMMVRVIEQLLQGKADGFGTFHYCGTPPTTRLEFVKAVLEQLAPFSPKRPRIVAAKSTDFIGLADRPHYSVLDCEKIQRVFGITQEPWLKGLKLAVPNWINTQGKAA